MADAEPAVPGWHLPVHHLFEEQRPYDADRVVAAVRAFGSERRGSRGRGPAAGDEPGDAVDGAERIGADLLDRQANAEMLLDVEQQPDHGGGIEHARLKQVLAARLNPGIQFGKEQALNFPGQLLLFGESRIN